MWLIFFGFSISWGLYMAMYANFYANSSYDVFYMWVHLSMKAGRENTYERWVIYLKAEEVKPNFDFY